jgi:hypothetical protein
MFKDRVTPPGRPGECQSLSGVDDLLTLEVG